MGYEVVQGSNGNVLSFTIREGNTVVDLTNATVELLLTLRSAGKIKQAEITDPINGKCRVVLSPDDILFDGVYAMQITVTFANGNQFTSSGTQKLTVTKKLGFIPVAGGGTGGSTNIVSGNNGHILVNGVDVKVYDDTTVYDQISTIQKSDVMTRLGVNTSGKLTIDGNEFKNGDSISTSTTNGNILINGQEFKVYDDSALSTFIPLLKRLGIDSNGFLTVDEKIVGNPTPTNTAPSISSSYSTTSVNNLTSISIPYTVTDVEGGTLTATYTIDGVISTSSVSTGANTWNIGTLSLGNHTLSIKVTDTGSLNSNVLTFNINVTSTTDTTPPNNVTNLTTSNLSTASVTLSWTASSSSDIASYDIYNGTTLVTNTANTSYTVTGLSAGTQYTFIIKAKDNSGNAASGTSVTITTVALDTTPPNNVTNLTTSNVTSTSLTLSWTASTSTDVASYDIYNGSTLLTNVTGTTYSVSGLIDSTQYTFTVKAKDNVGNVASGTSVTVTTISAPDITGNVDGGAFTDTSTSTLDGGSFTQAPTGSTVDAGTFADVTPPDNVTNLTASSITATSLSLSWTASDSTDIASYDVYNGSTLLGNTVSTSYNVSGLAEKTSYTFWIKAKDGSGNVASGTSLIVTTADVTAPVDVTNLSANNVSQTGLTLIWTASSSTDVASYDVYNDSTLLANVSGTTYNVSGLTASTTYTFLVKAKDASGNISSGTSLTVTTVSNTDTTPPAEVTNLVATSITTTSATLSWTASSSIDISSYDVYQGSTLLGNTSGTSYNVNSLSASTSYTFTIKAKDTSGNVSTGTSITFATADPDVTPPVEVTNLATSNVTQTSLSLTWTASTSSDIASYDVYNGSTLLGNTTGTNYNVTGLTASTSYTFTIKSKDTSGNVSTGVSVSVTTTSALQDVTSLSYTNLTNDSVKLTWQSSPSTDKTGYNVYNGATLLTTLASSAVNYTVTGLTAQQTYTFTVKTKNATGAESNGASVTITTPIDTFAPNNVTELGAINITTNSLRLSWVASTSTDIASYDVYQGATKLGNTTGKVYDVTGLTAGTSFSFTVKSIDGVGNVSSGTTVSVYTLASDVVWTKTYNAQSEQVTIDHSANLATVFNTPNTASNYDSLQIDSNNITYNNIGSTSAIAITAAKSNFAISYKGTVTSQLKSPVAAGIISGAGQGLISPNNYGGITTSNVHEYRFEYRNGTLKCYVDGKDTTPTSFTFDSTNVNSSYTNIMNIIGTLDSSKNYAVIGLGGGGKIYDVKYGEW